MINLVPRATAEATSSSSPGRGSDHFDSFERASQQEGLSPEVRRPEEQSNRSSLMHTRILKQQEEPALSEEDEEIFGTPRGESPSLLGGNPRSALGCALLAEEPLPNYQSTQTAEFNEICNIETQHLGSCRRSEARGATAGSRASRRPGESESSELDQVIAATEIRLFGAPALAPAAEATRLSSPPSESRIVPRVSPIRRIERSSIPGPEDIFDYCEADSPKNARQRAIERAERILGAQLEVSSKPRNLLADRTIEFNSTQKWRNKGRAEAALAQARTTNGSFVGSPS